MQIVRFLFGHGWWILWHVAFWAILLFFVGLILAMFGSELKAAGEKPDTPSPGSFLVVMIGVGLMAVTLVNASIFAAMHPWPWWGRAGLIIGLPALVGLIAFPLNLTLATDQHRPIWWANVGFTLVVIAMNLWLLWQVENRP